MTECKPEPSRDSRVVAIRLQPEELAVLTELVNKVNASLEKPTATPSNLIRRLILQASQSQVEPLLACCLPQDRRLRGVVERPDGSVRGCQSEDERLLLEALLVWFTKESVEEPALGVYRGAILYQQYRTCGYILDFAVLGANLRLAVEVDGLRHNTSRQAGVDRKRDRLLVKEGWRVLRFTTQEVTEDSPACASEVVTLVDAPSLEATPVKAEPPPGADVVSEVGNYSQPTSPTPELNLAALLDDIELGSRVTPSEGVYAGVRGRVTRLVEGKATVEFKTAQGNVLTATLAVDQLQAL
jgi:very-short-patch-repair endonuclease